MKTTQKAQLCSNFLASSLNYSQLSKVRGGDNTPPPPPPSESNPTPTFPRPK